MLALTAARTTAQVQSVDRRGAFRIALGGGILPELLARALVEDERIEWDKWSVSTSYLSHRGRC